MGLDNIPKEYPCKKEKTAIMKVLRAQSGEPLLNEAGEEQTQIDCESTQAADGCPYRREYEKSGLEGGAVYGIFGAECWYRGKWGNAVLGEVGITEETFYGDNDDETVKSPTSCITLSEVILSALEESGENVRKDLVADLTYAAWWLRFIAEFADGCDCWY